jgi:hypothetical protein
VSGDRPLNVDTAHALARLVQHALAHLDNPNDDDDAMWLVAPVLSGLACRGVQAAIASLRAILERIDTDRVGDALYVLCDDEGEALIPDLGARVCERYPDDDSLRAAVDDFSWWAWRTKVPPEWVERLLAALRSLPPVQRDRRLPTIVAVLRSTSCSSKAIPLLPKS